MGGKQQGTVWKESDEEKNITMVEIGGHAKGLTGFTII